VADESAEKTEPATPKKRSDARERGEVAQSKDVGAVVGMLVAFALLFGSAGASLGRSLADVSRMLWSGAALRPERTGDFHALLLASGAHVATALLPLLGCLWLAAMTACLLQVGPLFTTKAFELKLERMNPLQGLKRIFSPERTVDLLKSLCKLGVVAGVLWWASRDGITASLTLLFADPASLLPISTDLAWDLVVPMLSALALIAAADVLWVRFQHDKKLRMSKQEVREEMMDREGNPHVRAKMRAQARELSRLRLVAEVSKADVVVRNPTHFAVALAYERASMAAPRVVAKGRNALALRILEIARHAEVPIVEDPPIARLLYRTAKVGKEIPVALYQAIAEVLAHVYRLDRRRASGWGVAP
jgi:flagellar biosynthetic protein FlhB